MELVPAILHMRALVPIVMKSVGVWGSNSSSEALH